MKNRTAHVVGLFAALWLPVAGMAAQAGSKPAPASSTLQRQLHHTRAELQHQRAQTDQLRKRVNDLEQRSAANRTQLEQRDREIESLRRKLATMPASQESAPAPAGSR